jgi:hypothetical protein
MYDGNYKGIVLTLDRGVKVLVEITYSPSPAPSPARGEGDNRVIF